MVSSHTTAKDSLRNLQSQAISLRDQATQALSLGIHSPGAGLAGGLIVKALIPHGYKGLARGAGRAVQKTSQVNLRAQWLQAGRTLLSQSEAAVREMSIRSRNLPPHGNSTKLLVKFNRVRRATNPITLLSTLAVVLEELSAADLLWNREIPAELQARKEAVELERRSKAELKASAPRYLQVAATIDLYNRSSISGALRMYPEAEQSMLGALDRLAVGGPDAERHALLSCRAAIENTCTRIGGNGDWKTALKTVLPSESDQKAVFSVVNYLGSKVHGGHTPTRAEADQGLRLTIATLESIAERIGTRAT